MQLVLQCKNRFGRIYQYTHDDTIIVINISHFSKRHGNITKNTINKPPRFIFNRSIFCLSHGSLAWDIRRIRRGDRFVKNAFAVNFDFLM